MIRFKFVASLLLVMLFAFSLMAQSSNDKKPITKTEAVEIQSNIIKSITYPTGPLINKKIATVHPSTLSKGKAKNEENKKLKSKAIKK